MKRCIVTIAFREPYVSYQDYLFKSLQSIGNTIPVVSWRDSYPQGCPTHQEKNYAFKLWCIRAAREQGYDQVLWLDTSCYVHAPLDPFFDRITRDGHYFLVGADLLGKWSSDACLKHYGIARDDAMQIKLVSGTIYGFDFTQLRTKLFFESWFEGYDAGLFMPHYSGSYKDERRPGISDDPRVEGHRADEAVATCIAEHLEMKTTPIGDLFGGGLSFNPSIIVNSGYNLSARRPL